MMKNWQPQNELEETMRGAMKSPAGHPAFLRKLRESEICFLMPYHPELEADEGEEFSGPPPALAVWNGERGAHVPVFCSMERAQEALERMHPEDDRTRWIIGSMQGADLLAILGQKKQAMVLNPSCETGEVYLNATTVKNLAPGLILPKKGQSRRSAVSYVPPEDYPTDLVQALFTLMKTLPPVQAAWLFENTEIEEGEKPVYVICVHATGERQRVTTDVTLVAEAATPDTHSVGVALVNEQSAAANLKRFLPFYRAVKPAV
jgi:SseB protein C-terminal domain/SseB protein N-terminal domain